MPSEAGQPAQGPRAWRFALRIAAGAALLTLVVWYADPPALWAKLSRANPWLVALALAVSVVANLMCAMRWAVIARGLGLIAPSARLVLMYARGITTNMLLPGATLSGDLLRSVQLSRLGNPFVRSALSVFLDRLSGLWVLCVLSLLAAAGLVLWGAVGQGGERVAPREMSVYLSILAALAIAPFIPLPFGKLERSSIAWVATLASRWERLRERLRQARPALVASAWRSLGVQLLSACTLWICGMAVGVSLSYPVMLAAAAPIFIMAALPIGVAGFGTRELAAVIVLGLAGVPGDQATATALLYGLAAVIQGIVAAPLFFAEP
ncbi:MAG TPA: lysylphosphatidylglycerol synthase transmembrane domain-containing protein [Burkholderiales bacterium]|nr:lysylphosphatidylglycerol synthase transmembrane domain-containing protein [Burkholderiales bacterium]